MSQQQQPCPACPWPPFSSSSAPIIPPAPMVSWPAGLWWICLHLQCGKVQGAAPCLQASQPGATLTARTKAMAWQPSSSTVIITASSYLQPGAGPQWMIIDSLCTCTWANHKLKGACAHLQCCSPTAFRVAWQPFEGLA